MDQDPKIYYYQVGAVVDGERCHAPGAIVLRAETRPRTASGMREGTSAQVLRVLAVGSPSELRGHAALQQLESVGWMSAPEWVLMPGLINAHAHLDLTHIGPRPFEAREGFRSFVDVVRRERRVEEEAIAESVKAGVQLSLEGGVVAVGDVAGAAGGKPNASAAWALRASPLGGVSFVEFFAIGRGESRGWAAFEEAVRSAPDGIGISPHAPTTVSRGRFLEAVERSRSLGSRLMTHLAETPEEKEFIARASGPHRAFLEQLGLWDDTMLEEFGRGLSPVEHLAPVLRAAAAAGRPMLAAHVNDASDRDLAILAESGVTVVYCPRASTYFGAARHFGAHRYREMMARGVKVVLGTDSVINLPEDEVAGEWPRISVWDEMRLLRSRDGVDGQTLLRMCTTDAAAALGLREDEFVLREGSRPRGLIASVLPSRVDSGDPVGDALERGNPPMLLSFRT